MAKPILMVLLSVLLCLGLGLLFVQAKAAEDKANELKAQAEMTGDWQSYNHYVYKQLRTS